MTRCPICGEKLSLAGACPRCGGRIAAPERLLLPGSRGAIAQFLFGMKAFLDGIRFTLAEPALRRWVIVPVVLAVLVLIATTLGWWEILHALPDRLLASEWPALIDWLRSALHFLLAALLYPILLVLALLSTYVIVSVLMSPICDHLSAKTEELILGKAPPHGRGLLGFLHEDLYLPITQSLKLVTLQLLVTATLFLVSLSSAGIAGPLVPLATIYFAALASNDYPLARKHYGFREKLAYQHAHLAHHLGFGLLVYALPFCLPFAAVGATRSFLALSPK